jgi:protocatechuate 3,4-dioxygenase beta subunit
MSSDQMDFSERVFRRREAIVALCGVGFGVALAACGRSSPTHNVAAARASTAAGTTPDATCALTPEVTAGPFYIANHLTRRNITENQPGLPLALDLTVQDASTCKPIAGADVEVWHANAQGLYSGYGGSSAPGPAPGGGPATPNSASRFLRGHQKSDTNGKAIFDTIYPGWYMGRAPHIHVKVHVGGSVVHTGQLFFDDRTSDAVYRTAPYSSHGQPDTTDAQDSIYAQAGGSAAQVKLTKRSNGNGYNAAIALGVRS